MVPVHMDSGWFTWLAVSEGGQQHASNLPELLPSHARAPVLPTWRKRTGSALPRSHQCRCCLAWFAPRGMPDLWTAHSQLSVRCLACALCIPVTLLHGKTKLIAQIQV